MKSNTVKPASPKNPASIDKMERDGARQLNALKANLEQAMREAEAGDFEPFDPQLYEPDAGAG